MRGRDWYETPAARDLLKFSEGGKRIYTWRAWYDTGEIVDQLDADGNMKSVATLDREHVVRFDLIPSSDWQHRVPWLNPFSLRISLENGERFVSYWLTDAVFSHGFDVRRHVIGIEKAGTTFLTVVSPTGNVVVTTNENISYEGEGS